MAGSRKTRKLSYSVVRLHDSDNLRKVVFILDIKATGILSERQ